MYFYLLATIVLVVKNIFIDKKPLFTIITNLVIIALAYYLCDIGGLKNLNVDGDFYSGSNGVGEIYLISLIMTTLIIVFKLVFKMNKNIFCLICGIFLVGGVQLASQGSSDFLDMSENFISFKLDRYKDSLTVLLLQLNLFITFINANWDCLKKKSGEILDSKE